MNPIKSQPSMNAVEVPAARSLATSGGTQRARGRRIFTLASISIIFTCLTTLRADPPKTETIADLSKCLPASALSNRQAQGKWRVVSYETETIQGNMLTAASFIEAPPVTLPLDHNGWYAIRLAVWNPNFAYDGTPILKVKLSGDAAFRQIHTYARPDTQSTTYLREVFLGERDVTGKDLVIAKSNGRIAKSAYLAYVKLVPLTEKRVAEIKSDRQRTDTRNLVASIDGSSYFHSSEVSRPEHILELVELYRHSDVGKVLWAVTYGVETNFPTKVVGAEFLGETDRTRLLRGVPGNDYIRGESQFYNTLRIFAKRGIIPQQMAAKHVHDMGIKFDLMFRLGILGGFGFWRQDDNFSRHHPEFRQVRHDGTILEKMSYAFPEVQEIVLSLVRESTTLIDADGINLCFVRGPHFLILEEPIVEAFKKKYGEEPRKVDENDPRLLATRAEFMTRFLRNIRAVLDDVGKSKGKKLTLSAWVWPWSDNVWLGETPLKEGLDIKGWIREGLLDSLICQSGIDQEYIGLGKKHGCKFIHFTGYHGERRPNPKNIHAAYEKGVENFAFWDLDATQIVPSNWNWLRRIGHRDEVANWAKEGLPKEPLIPLIRLHGADVRHGLADAVYSGG